MVMAGRRGQMNLWLKQAGIQVGEDGILVYPDVYQALRMTSCYWEEEPETITLESEERDIAAEEAQLSAHLEAGVLESELECKLTTPEPAVTQLEAHLEEPAPNTRVRFKPRGG